MRLHCVMDKPDLATWLQPQDRTALRRAGVTVRQLSAVWEVTMRKLLSDAWAHDTVSFALRPSARGGPACGLVIYGQQRGRKVTFEPTEGIIRAVEIAQLAWVASVSAITLKFAVAKGNARG